MDGPDRATAPRKRQESAYYELRDLIVTGELAPGAPVIESHLAEQLGHTRAVVRAALRRLELEGYIKSVILKKYSRAVVAPLTAESVSELFTIMGALEGLAARNVAVLDDERRLQIADEMQSTNEALLAASGSGSGDVLQAQDLHVRFHNATAEAAAGPILYKQIDRLRYQAERYERLYTHVLIAGIENSVEEHAEIIAALRAGDADAAQRATETNWRNGADRYEGTLAAGRARGRL